MGSPRRIWGLSPMVPAPSRAHDRPVSKPTITTTNTTAFYAQACISFALSFGAVLIAIAYLPLGGWIRAFIALAILYVVTSTFTLAKVVRDKEETNRVVQRVDDARMERFLAEHDPLRPLV